MDDIQVASDSSNTSNTDNSQSSILNSNSSINNIIDESVGDDIIDITSDLTEINFEPKSTSNVCASNASSSNLSFENANEEPENKSRAEVLAANSSLCKLMVYSSGESGSEDDSDDSDSYDCVSVEDNQEPSIKPIAESEPVKKKKKNDTLLDTLKSMGELSIEDLPPVPNISELNVTVKKEECDEMGKISSIVDKLVMVESIPNKPAYNIDTLLFLDSGKQPLGYIFDVIGAVTCPMYAIRFNTAQEIAALNITKGLPVYSAPKTEHAQYVFVQQLLQAKGTDASWKDDLEVPQEYQDFSDDESECCKPNSDNRKRNSIERYQTFEKDMNVKNLINTRLHKIRDNFEPMQKKHTPNNNYKRGYHFQPNYRPNFGFSQPNASSTSCAFPPPFGIPPFMPSNMPMPPPYGPQNLPPFVPNMPPPHGFMPRFAPPPMPPFPPPMQQGVPYATSQEMVNAMFQMGPNTSKTVMMYPPDMSAPRPPSQNPNFVPNMPFFDPRVRMWHNFHGAPPPNTRQPFHNHRNQYPRRQ